jgi:hypothetical protein
VGGGFTRLTFDPHQETPLHHASTIPRIEIGGGLYHLITRGNNRRKIFDLTMTTSGSLVFSRSRKPNCFYIYA